MLRCHLIFACILCCLLTSPCVFAQSVTDIGLGYSVSISDSGTIYSYNGLEYYRNSTSSYVYPGSYGIYGPPSVTVDGGSLAISGGIFATTGTYSVSGGSIVYSPVDVLSGDVLISGGNFAGSGGGVLVRGGNVSIVGGSISGTPFVSFSAGNEYDNSGSAVTAIGGTTKIAGGSFHVASATIPGIGLNILWGGVVDLFGTFSQSTTIINGSGYGTIRGTLLDGEAIDTTYSVTNATLEFNVGTPPFAITAVKLGLPRLVTDPSGNAFFTEGVYLKGAGQGTFSGHWVQTGLDYPTIGQTFTKSVDLSSGSWVQGDTLSLPWDNIHNKSYTVAFSLDAPTSVQTDQLKSSVTGFRPDRNGWKYQNPSGFIYFRGTQPVLQLDGLCMGMASTALYYYSLGQPLPQTRFAFTDVQEAQFQGQGDNSYLAQVDVPRFNKEIRLLGSSFAASQPEIATLHGQLQTSPALLCLCYAGKDGSFTGFKAGGHAVLATAGFSSPSLVDDSNQAIDTNNMQEVDNVDVFSFYDPNFPNQFRGIFLGTSNAQNLIQPFPDFGSFYDTLAGVVACGYKFIPVH